MRTKKQIAASRRNGKLGGRPSNKVLLKLLGDLQREGSFGLQNEHNHTAELSGYYSATRDIAYRLEAALKGKRR